MNGAGKKAFARRSDTGEWIPLVLTAAQQLEVIVEVYGILTPPFTLSEGIWELALVDTPTYTLEVT
jgi:hypothetical protein